jgi:hypothetical protein
MINEDIFWNSSIEELKSGYKFENNIYQCIFCGTEFKNGMIFNNEKEYYDAQTAVQKHIEGSHVSSFEYLINLDKRINGLSDIQKSIGQSMYNHDADDVIAASLGNKARSTVRNHKFVMREKYKEAKIFIAIMEMIWEKEDGKMKFVNFHKDIPVSDDRIIITEEEKDKILKKYFDGESLKRFPKKEKEKLVILQKIVKSFDDGVKYDEKQVNEILKRIYSTDHVGIRRYLVDYKFMERTPDCSEYRVKN